MTITADHTTTTLSVALREGTRTDHDHAEGADFIGALMSGRLPLGAYIALAAQQHAIYGALEAAVTTTRTGEPRLAALFDPLLDRTAAIEADLDYLTEGLWRADTPTAEWSALPATERYVEAINEATPLQLIAHHYVRYLGDLSGGQVVRRRLQETYGLSEAGLAFYTFAGIERIKPYRDGYRRALDELALPADQQAVVVAEAQAAFGHNRDMFGDLGQRWLAWCALTPTT